MPRIVAGGGVSSGEPATRLKLAVLAGLCAAVTAMIWASSGADAQSAEPGRVAFSEGALDLAGPREARQQ